MREHYDSLFDQLADGQHPHTMSIRCADSRISPAQMMGTHPGDLFIVRCIGALVPEAGHEHMTQEGAALEYGVGVLGVRHVVVCGHKQVEQRNQPGHGRAHEMRSFGAPCQPRARRGFGAPCSSWWGAEHRYSRYQR